MPSIRRTQAHLLGQEPRLPMRRPSPNGSSSTGTELHVTIPVLELLDAILIAPHPHTADGPSFGKRSRLRSGWVS